MASETLNRLRQSVTIPASSTSVPILTSVLEAIGIGLLLLLGSLFFGLAFDHEPIPAAEGERELVVGLEKIWLEGQSPDNANPLTRSLASATSGVISRIPLLSRSSSSLVTLIALALILVLVLAGLAAWRRQVVATTASLVSTTIRKRVHRQAYRQGRSSLPGEITNTVIDLFTIEADDVREAIRSQLINGVRIPLLITVFAIGILLSTTRLDQPISLAALGGSMIAWTFWQSGILRQRRDELGLEAARQLSLLRGDLTMLRTVRMCNAEEVEHRRFDAHMDTHGEAERERLLIQGTVSPLLFLLIGAGTALGLGILGLNLVNDRMSPTTSVGLVLSLGLLTWPIRDLIRSRAVIERGEQSAERIDEYLNRDPDLLQDGRAQFMHPVRDRIHFDRVTLSDGAGRILLDEASAEIPAGTKCAVLGLDNDSKLALFSLLPRLVDPEQGTVRIDNVDLRLATFESIRDQVAGVLQDELVFDGTVAENIALGNPRVGLPRIIEAAKLVHAHNFIQELSAGYETVIGSRGQNLSIGQKYRIALARAYLSEPSIMLIDEPRVPLDHEVKSYVDDAIQRLQKDRTLIFLAHRLSTIRSADQVLILHDGRFVASGPPAELKQTSKLFRQLQVLETNPFSGDEIEANASVAD